MSESEAARQARIRGGSIYEAQEARIHTLTQQVEEAKSGLRAGLRGLRYARSAWSPGYATTVAEAERAVEAVLNAMEEE